MDWRSLWQELLAGRQGRVAGAALGFLFAILILAVGLVKTLFVFACLFIGYFLGKRADENGGWGEFWRRLFGDR